MWLDRYHVRYQYKGMSKTEKLLAAARNNPGNVRFSDLVRLLSKAGFLHDRTRGSHQIWIHASRAEVPALNVQDKNGMAKRYQVEQFLMILDEYNVEV